MSKKINTTSIGLFIVIGAALGVAGLLVFSSSKFFSTTKDAIIYFDQSLNGLSEGAAVKYQGVTIGSVRRVMVHFNQAPDDNSMPVIIQFEKRLVQVRLGDAKAVFSEQRLEQLITNGLRATLESESLVTGVLYVEIHIHADAPPPRFHQLVKIYPEIPSVPTKLQQLMENLASLDLKSLQTNLNGLITRLDSTIGELKVAEINQGVSNLLSKLDRLASSAFITNDLALLGTTLEQYRELGAKLTSRVDPLADSITNSLAEASRALAQLRGAGENLRRVLAPDSPLQGNLDQALEQLTVTAQSISALTDFLKLHPNALIAGRENPKRKP